MAHRCTFTDWVSFLEAASSGYPQKRHGERVPKCAAIKVDSCVLTTKRARWRSARNGTGVAAARSKQDCGGSYWALRPLNISPTGMFLTFPLNASQLRHDKRDGLILPCHRNYFRPCATFPHDGIVRHDDGAIGSIPCVRIWRCFRRRFRRFSFSGSRNPETSCTTHSAAEAPPS
jgi:hypothetical protein